jgi:acyl-CoA dehydrogenase
MSETGRILVDTATRLFQNIVTPNELARAEAGEWPGEVWNAVEELGLPLALVPEDQGGFGIDPVEALAAVRVAAAFALPLPLGETMLANRLLAGAGIDAPGGALSVAPITTAGRTAHPLALVPENGGWRLTGVARRVPWGGKVSGVVVVAEAAGVPHVALVPAGRFDVAPGTNLAGEPRDDLSFDCILEPSQVAPAAGVTPEGLHAAGAALRSIQIAGALARVLEMTVQYANERSQFGRPIGKFQAIQQSLAVLAGQTAAASAAADLAAEAITAPVGDHCIAVAKARTGEAASVAAAIAHQVHGAIGFTHEHSLHHLTRRLWSWRDEFGNDAEWSRRLGHAAIAAGADGLWPMITAA